MLKPTNIVRSRKQPNQVIPYIINEIEGDTAKCTNLIDSYSYPIPLEDLYLWIISEDRKHEQIKVNVTVEIGAQLYRMDKGALPQEEGYVIVIDAGCYCGGDVPYSNLDVFKVKSVQTKVGQTKVGQNTISGVEVYEPVQYFKTLDVNEFAVLVPCESK